MMEEGRGGGRGCAGPLQMLEVDFLFLRLQSGVGAQGREGEMGFIKSERSLTGDNI